MKLEQVHKEGKEYTERYMEESEESFVMVKEKKPLYRQVEEGIYNIKSDDYDDNNHLRENSVVCLQSRASVSQQ